MAEKHRMKLTIPINWADDYFDRIDFSQTAEIYGKLGTDLIGGGRPSMTMPKVKKTKVEEFVKEAHKRDLEFNYLINGTCFDNQEASKKGYRAIRKQLDWLAEMGVDTITVALPMILEIIKKNYPLFKTSVSIQVRVDGFVKAKYWEDLGADKINISYVDVNKDLDTIRQIKKHTKCKIQTIANLICLNKCPMVTLHGNCNAHASQKGHVMDNFSFDYYLLNCSARLLSDPVEILKSAFIRPEDLHYYEDAGLDYMKLVERSMTTDALSNIVKAYTDRSYDGNMMDLVHGLSKYIIHNEKNNWSWMKYFAHPFKVNIFKAKEILDHLVLLKKDKNFNDSFDLYIDNKKLDGFFAMFYQGKCNWECKNCNHCEMYARKAIRLLVPEEQHQKNMASLRGVRESMIDGRLFA